MIQNNNQSMKTVVETFLIEETIELIHDNDKLDQWNERVNELGLWGQTQVVVEKKSPVPYMWMNSALVKTFEVLCPTKEAIEKYNKTPIPVEILDLVLLSKKEEHFDFVEIWYNEKNADPVCIGYKYNLPSSESEWWRKNRADKYLIGRWADVKASIDSLIERAKKIFMINETVRLKQDIKRAQRDLEDLETKVNESFGGAMPSTVLAF